MACPHCGADNEPSALECAACGHALGALAAGRLVASRFEILSRVGSGGMGVVYKAHDRELDEVVALKVLRGDLSTSEEMARRFRSEIKLARRVRDPHVCGIHEYGHDGPLRYIVMEFLDGVDLRRVLGGGALPPPRAFAIGGQIASALEAIHQAGIVHRDLKPANVMIDSAGRARLMDFGIAKQFGQASSTALTAIGQIVGTPEYMSPEQVRGEPLDERSDIYSLGVVLYELFTGRVPFRGPTAVATLYQHVHEPIPVEQARAAGAPEAVIPVLVRALAKAAGERYASAAELGATLEEAERATSAEGRRKAPARASATTTARVQADLALQPEPDPVPAPSLPATLPADAPTAVRAPAPGRRAYAGPRPRPAARASPPARPRVLAAAASALAISGAAALAWLYEPQLREGWRRFSAAAGPPPATAAPEPVPRTVPARAAPAEPASTAPATMGSVPAPSIASAEPTPAEEPTPAAAPPARAEATLAPPPTLGRPREPPPSPAPTPVREPEPLAAPSLDRAEELFASGRFGSALAEARAVLAREPGNLQARQLAEDAEVELFVEERLKDARTGLAAGDEARALDALAAGLARKPTDARLVALRRQITGR